MNDGNPYRLLPVPILRQLRDKKVETIRKDRQELEMLEMLLRDAEDPVMGALLTAEDRAQLLTSGGNVRGLTSWATKILRKRMKVMSASQIADVMYSYSWPVDVKAFRRRVVVAVSAVACDKDESKRTIVNSQHTADNREVLWALPNWIHNGELIESYLPWVK